MALIDHVVTLGEVGAGRSLEQLVEEFAWRVPVSEETLSQLDHGSRHFYMQRLRQHTAPPLSELAARCVRNEGLRKVASLPAPIEPQVRYQKRAHSDPVPEVPRAAVGHPGYRYQRSVELVEGKLNVFVGVSPRPLQTSAVG